MSIKDDAPIYDFKHLGPLQEANLFNLNEFSQQKGEFFMTPGNPLDTPPYSEYFVLHDKLID